MCFLLTPIQMRKKISKSDILSKNGNFSGNRRCAKTDSGGTLRVSDPRRGPGGPDKGEGHPVCRGQRGYPAFDRLPVGWTSRDAGRGAGEAGGGPETRPFTHV